MVKVQHGRFPFKYTTCLSVWSEACAVLWKSKFYRKTRKHCLDLWKFGTRSAEDKQTVSRVLG